MKVIGTRSLKAGLSTLEACSMRSKRKGWAEKSF
jgi:hypothetical protein